MHVQRLKSRRSVRRKICSNANCADGGVRTSDGGENEIGEEESRSVFNSA